MSSEGVLADIAEERQRQDAKWGEQNHLDGTGPNQQPLRAMADLYFVAAKEQFTGEEFADELAVTARAECQSRGKLPGHPDTWTAILLEELFEALAEDDPAALRKELIQVAAVATQWVEAIDRRQSLMLPTRAAS